MARNTNRLSPPPLALIVWANIVKWATVRGISDDEISAVLGVTRLYERKKSKHITVSEMENICRLLAVEPEKLLER